MADLGLDGRTTEARRAVQPLPRRITQRPLKILGPRLRREAAFRCQLFQRLAASGSRRCLSVVVDPGRGGLGAPVLIIDPENLLDVCIPGRT
jgi:hypothetical protein